MPSYEVTVRGRRYEVTVPDGQNEKHAAAYAMREEAQRIREESQQKAAKIRSPLRRVDDFVRGVADTVTLGTADEIAAKLSSLTGIGGQGGKPGDYTSSVAAERARDKTGGVERFGGQVAGAFMLPTTNIAAAPGLAGWAGAAAEGAAYGGAYGAGSAEGGLKKRAKAALPSAALGAAGGVAGKAIGNVVSRALRGPEASPAVRTLADEGVVMTPGRRGGPVARTVEEGVLGSIPFVKSIPAAANRRSVEQFNVAAYNRVLKPIGVELPMDTPPGREAIAALGETVYGAYDAAASRLALAPDPAIDAAKTAILSSAKGTVGSAHADQLATVINRTLEPLDNGAISGGDVANLLSDLRGEASGWMTGNATKSEQNVGKELWKLHDAIEGAVERQNPSGMLEPFKAARQSVSLLKRVESAAAATKTDGIFNPQQFATAISKRGYGTTTANVARGAAPMQDLADAAKQVLPARIPNSGTAERVTGVSGLLGLGGAASHFVNPVAALPAMTIGGLLTRYTPGVDRLLQDFALNRPDMFIRGADAVGQAAPYLSTAGALTAAEQGR